MLVEHADDGSLGSWSAGYAIPRRLPNTSAANLLSPEAFAKARQEYQRATANYAPPYHAGFTLHKPDERALLEIWHIGYGPHITCGLCVADPKRLLERSG